MVFGSKPVDNGNFFFTDEEKAAFLTAEPGAAVFIRPLLSAWEYLHGENRWCLWLKDADPALLRRLSKVLERIEAVKEFRLASKKGSTREAAAFPTLFTEDRQPTSSFVLVQLSGNPLVVVTLSEAKSLPIPMRDASLRSA